MTDKTLARIADALESLVDAYTQARPRDHYALTDRYAANEARQREEAEPDPLDEDDHRDRIDTDGRIVRRKGHERWAWPGVRGFHSEHVGWPLSSINAGADGPLAFAPDASPAPQDAAQGAAEGESDSDAVEGDGAAGPPEALAQQDLRPYIEQIAADAKAFAKASVALLLCHQCSHDIEQHREFGCIPIGCPCGLSVTDIAHHLIAQATS